MFIYKPLLYCYLLTAFLMPAKPAEVARHPLHISKADISLNEQSKHLEIICSIFTDDFESALAKQNPEKIDLSDQAKHAAMEPLVKKYVLAHLLVSTNSKAAPLAYVGFEREKEMVNIYLESGDLQPLKKLDADVSLLYDLYDDQSNIVHITVKGKRNSTKLDYPAKRVSESF